MHLAWPTIRRFGSLFVAAVAALFLLIPQAHAYYTNMPASVVIGQSDFTHVYWPGEVSANVLNWPAEGSTDGQRLFVSEGNGGRVLIFNHIPTTNNASADVVIGQSSFTGGSANQGGSPGANTLNGSAATYSDGHRLFIADFGNSRVLIFNHIPTTNNASADVVIGQPDFSSSSINQCGCLGPKDNSLFGPSRITTDGTRLMISDDGNARVLIFNHLPTTNNASADVVIGASNFTTRNQSTTADKFKSARAYTDWHRIIIADTSNHRVLIYNTIPTSNGTSADVVIGQINFSNNSANQGTTPGPNTLKNPGDSGYDGRRLFLPDFGNNRVLIFNNIPTSNDAAADIVIGQPDFIQNNANQGGSPNQNTLSGPVQATIFNHQLFVTEALNNRVLIFSNDLPDVSLTRTITGQPNGLLRFSGTASTNVTNEIVKQIEYSVNGGTWTGGFPTDGKFDSASEQYYFDFDPKANTMADNQGYTVKIRSSHGNDIDTSKDTMYFEPFIANSPEDNTFRLNRLPTFSFSIQKQRFSDLKENLDHFRIMISTDNQNWTPYIDNIPVDYNSVRQSSDNLKPNPVDTMNGTYEDKFKIVQYEQDNSVITVSPKSVDSQGNSSDKDINNGGKQLANATYYWRVEAEDHAGQIQYTDPKVLRIGTRQVVTSRKFFPITITGIGGKNGAFNHSTENLSSVNGDRSPVSVLTRWPTFAGIAMAGTTVTLSLKDTNCTLSDSLLCVKTYETTVKPDSTFRKTISKALKVGETYGVTVSVKDTGDNYNELPEFLITIQAQ